ncbi:DUF1694 domain-containing protein [Streptococcus sciuri]|uniref:DUF1694 domain-containing protein n=1 Tax=Streptococcus sciuri TaxID=2973939 RepID=A0ABT2F5U7_9STRE|nr:DUF1694 domain-containing protein [Streptococcus sciuri]MCS4487760.1 DUF1694 domain-containing protein [Streptococcus sciuri]
MTDLDTRILQTAAGGLKCNPDEQRKYLTTFEERVIANCNIEEANSDVVLNYFQEILEKICQDFQPVLVKISPEIDSQKQISYLKTAQNLGCNATIVSEKGHSPFGLVIHTDHPVEKTNKEISILFAELLKENKTKNEPKKSKNSFWRKFF